MSSDTAPSALGSRRFSYLYSARITWGGWGSNPRPADYEKYGLVHRTHYLHGYHGAVPPMALIALLAPMARSTNRSTPTPLHRASLLLYVTSLGIRPHKWTRLSAPDGLTGAVMRVLACQYVAGYRNSLREGASVYPCGDGPVETPAFGLGPRERVARGVGGAGSVRRHHYAGVASTPRTWTVHGAAAVRRIRHPIQPLNHTHPGSVLRSKEGSGWSAGALTADASLIFVSKPTGLTERG